MSSLVLWSPCSIFSSLWSARLGLRAGFLLIGHGAAPRTLAGTRIGVSALAAHRQPAAMPHAAIGAHLDQALDVHRDLFAQVAFNRTFGLENRSDMVDFV